jgi:hypothetical protein
MTTAKQFFEIEQSAHGSQWETVENGRAETLDEARALMSEAETKLGWRDLRIVECEETATAIRTLSVVEFGAESDVEDE